MKLIHHILHQSLWITLPVACLLIAGCTTTTTQSFIVNKNARVEASYVATDADFGGYDRLYASDMGIFFPTDAAPSLDDQKRTRQVFREACLRELAGYQIVRDKGPSALDVQATPIDHRNASGANVPNVRRESRTSRDPRGRSCS